MNEKEKSLIEVIKELVNVAGSFAIKLSIQQEKLSPDEMQEALTVASLTIKLNGLLDEVSNKYQSILSIGDPLTDNQINCIIKAITLLDDNKTFVSLSELLESVVTKLEVPLKENPDSLLELDTLIFTAGDLGFMRGESYARLIDESAK